MIEILEWLLAHWWQSMLALIVITFCIECIVGSFGKAIAKAKTVRGIYFFITVSDIFCGPYF